MQDDRNQLFFDFYEDVSHSEEDKESSHPGVSNVIDKLNFDTEEEALEVLTGKKSIKDVIEDDTENWSSCDAGNPEDMAAKAWLENRDASVISPESSSNPIPGMEGNGSPFPDVSGVSSDLSDTANAVSLRDDHVSLDSAEPSVIPEKEQSEGSAEFGEPSKTVSSDAVLREDVPIIKNKKHTRCVAMSLPLLRRAALGFLGSLNPSCVALRVPSAVPRVKADAAAFWIPSKCHVNLTPARSAMVFTYLTCPDFSRDEKISSEYFSALQNLEREKTELESYIRQNEPYTQLVSLFDKEIKWDYSLSRNLLYKRCLKRMERMKQSQPAFNLYERLIQEQAADELYIAAPAGVIPVDLIPKGWGFVEFAADLTPTLVIPAVNFNISAEKRCILSWRIAGMSVQNVMFANGVEIAETPEIRLIPKRRSFVTTEKI